MQEFAPIAGDDYREWSDRLRDVEEMIADPELRAEAARIRGRARAIRKDLKKSDKADPRHSPEPNWDLIKMQVSEPLAELESRIQREILRRDDRAARVPLNREPVPQKYEKAVNRYFEEIGSGE